MYTTYKYFPGATGLQVVADLALLLTGTTDKSLLSSGCDKNNTSIISTVPAGWALIDANVATGKGRAFSAPIANDPTMLKYLVLDTTPGSCMLTKVYETWNSTTHVGTNIAYSSDTTTLAPVTTYGPGGTLLISASNRHCLIASLDNNQTTFTPGSGIVEYTRTDTWNTVINGYPCFAYFNTTNFGTSISNTSSITPSIYSPRMYNTSTGVDVTGALAYMGVYSPMLCTTAMNASTISYGYSIQGLSTAPATLSASASKTPVHLLVPLGLARNGDNISSLGGDISANCGIYATTIGAGSYLNEMVVGSDSYVIWVSGQMMPGIQTTSRFAIKKA